MRPSLAGTYTAHVADSQRSLPATRCCQYKRSRQIAKAAVSGSNHNCHPRPIRLRGSTRWADVGLPTTSFLTKRRLPQCTTTSTLTTYTIVREIGERLLASLKTEPELPANLRMQIDRLRELEEQSRQSFPMRSIGKISPLSRRWIGRTRTSNASETPCIKDFERVW
jgi:hypothetical protein